MQQYPTEPTRREIKQNNYCMSICLFIMPLTSTGALMFTTFVSLCTDTRCSNTLPFHHVERGGVRTTCGCRVEMSTFGPETSVSCFHPAHAQSVVRFIFKRAKKPCFGSTSTRMGTVNLFSMLWGLTQRHIYIYIHKEKEKEKSWTFFVGDGAAK